MGQIPGREGALVDRLFKAQVSGSIYDILYVSTWRRLALSPELNQRIVLAVFVIYIVRQTNRNKSSQPDCSS